MSSGKDKKDVILHNTNMQEWKCHIMSSDKKSKFSGIPAESAGSF